jgi:EAL domain-containing protein (putative c-di-GMP-specific phosphodiesterase class I)
LEITESVAMEDAPATAAALKELDTLGVRMIIDNFGTGYSSLSPREVPGGLHQDRPILRRQA